MLSKDWAGGWKTPLRVCEGATGDKKVALKKIRLDEFCIEYCIRNAGYLHFLLEPYRKEEMQLFSAKLPWHVYNALQWMSISALQGCSLCISSLFLRAFATCVMNGKEDEANSTYLKGELLSPTLVKCFVGERLKHIKLNDSLRPFLGAVCGSQYSMLFLVPLTPGSSETWYTPWKQNTLWTKQHLSYLLTLKKKMVFTIWSLSVV